MKRVEKLKLLAALITGTVTSKQVADLRKSQEPIFLTMNLEDDDNKIEVESDEPTFNMEVYSDGTTKSYDRYQDGRIEYRII
ncbi:hypothetical protein GCM10027592_03340 [Spirosoma flavus]